MAINVKSLAKTACSRNQSLSIGHARVATHILDAAHRTLTCDFGMSGMPALQWQLALVVEEFRLNPLLVPHLPYQSFTL